MLQLIASVTFPNLLPVLLSILKSQLSYILTLRGDLFARKDFSGFLIYFLLLLLMLYIVRDMEDWGM